ncbi:MAG: response regulator [Spirochaetes bacterium]|nr:response regulator [Spirochaetota bacterium]
MGSILWPVILLSFLWGITFIGTLMYIYLYINIRRRLFLAVTLFGLIGLTFAGSEILVIVLGSSGAVKAGLEFHRIEALSVLFFIPMCPFFLNEILDLGSKYKNLNTWIFRTGIALSVIFITAAFIRPELFLEFERHPEFTVTPWNASRGVPGPLYDIRGLIVMFIGIYTIASIAADIILHGKLRYLGLILAGIVIAIIFGLTDIIMAAYEKHTGLFSVRVISYFCAGLTLFIILSMISVMRLFIDQGKEIENSRKIDSLGILAGGLAHDFNNILSGILGNITLLIDKAKQDDPGLESMMGIEYAAYRARALTQQLLTFSRGGSPIKETSHIMEIVEETVNFVLSGSKVRPRFKVQPNLKNVHVDAGQISQVIQNLVINALDAVNGEEGFIDITFENDKCRFPGTSDREPADCIKIEVRDYGCGISTRALPYIFDPYYTTKDRGSGLGLAICYSIIRKHDGNITVHSRPGEGTVMTVYLPAVDEQPDTAPSVEKRKDIFKGDILVMDDDPVLRTTLERMLTHIGFSVTAVPDGASAVEAVKKSAESGKILDAVIMDLTVSGGMGGQKAAGLISAIVPGLPLVVASGYSDDPVMAHYGDYGFSARLIKPVSLDDLRLVMLEVLPVNNSLPD